MCIRDSLRTVSPKMPEQVDKEKLPLLGNPRDSGSVECQVLILLSGIGKRRFHFFKTNRREEGHPHACPGESIEESLVAGNECRQPSLTIIGRIGTIPDDQDGGLGIGYLLSKLAETFGSGIEDRPGMTKHVIRAPADIPERQAQAGIPDGQHGLEVAVDLGPLDERIPKKNDPVAIPELKIIAYHMAWPHHEELMGLAGKHVNLYLSLSGIIGWLARAPYRGYHMIGEALQWVSDDKIVMGLDLAFDDMPLAVDYIRNLEMPEELQEKWGYKPVSEETKAKILGLNLARLAKIDPKKRV